VHMNKLYKLLNNTAELRKAALLRQSHKTIDTQGMSADEIAKAFFNLETHKIELDLQSEEMLRVNDELYHLKDEYTELYDDAPIGYFTLNLNGVIINCNKKCCEILGFAMTRPIDKRFSDFVAPSGQDTYFIANRELLKHKKSVSYDLPICLSNGSKHWVSVEAMFVNNKGEKQDELRLAISNIDIRIQLETQRRKLSCAVQFSASGVCITDLDGCIEYANPKFCEITGYTEDELIGHTPSLLRSPGRSKGVYKDLWKTIKSGKPWSGEHQNKRKDGSLYWGRSTISCVYGNDGNDGDMSHYVMVQNDITREYELNVQLNYQASHDALTDLINRAEFERRMKRLLSEKTTPDIKHAFCFMDLDQFKIINDTCGHHAGDQLLRQIAQLLQTSVRKRDTLARLGGDEFALLMEHCSLDKAQDVAYAMLDSVKDYRFYWKGQTFQIGISIGLVEIEPSSATVEEFMKQADAACYVAKRLGRNRIHLYCPDDTELVRRYGEVHWLGLINKAFNEDHFKLYAQPIRSFGNNPEHVHYELLLRMQGDDGEIITPERFLPAAERYGLMPKLDSWVIETALNKLAESAAFMSRVEFVSINLSGASMSNNNILKVIESAINRSCYAPDKFCFEITETAAISNMVAAVEMANNLKALGCRLALDDFGTGLSSFSYLKSLPVDYLKVDGMFIKDIANDSFNEAMVKSINDISHVMHIRTIAEFVEDVETSDMLQMMGVDYGQGFYLGRPELLDDLIARTKTC